MKQNYDLLIIGGGINGAGIAADAAGRGLTVALCEKDDLANATSSYSSKMIHGGLRYLENYEFRLVREALQEREVLLKAAPHLIHPLRLIVPHNRQLRPYWVIRLGLFLYDHLASNQTLPKCETIYFRGESKWPVDSKFKKGFAYSDAAVDDSRLVVANALAAKQRGADIFTRHEVVSAIRSNGSWEVQVIDRKTESYKTFRAKALVNASGPWVDRILHQLQLPARHSVRLVKGSHIVVPKLYEGSYAYLLQNHDRRVIFVIPYQEHFTLIGTTDVDYQGDPNHARISVEEQKYLCEAVNRYFKQTLEPKHIVWSYAGVRPLQHDEHADPSKVTRDYTFEIQDDNNALPVMSVFGGKITTYRRLAEHALEKLAPYFPNMKKAWTANSPLPGGDVKSFSQLVLDLQRDYPWLSAEHLERLAKAYGSKAYQVLADAKSPQDLGIHFGGSLYEREVRYMIEQEWAYTIEDILWRRSKQGLLLTEAQVRQLSEWLHTQNLP